MDALLFVALVIFSAGAFAGIQGPLNALLSSRIGLLEGAFAVHLVGMVFAGIPLLLMAGGGLVRWQSAPWYAWLGGIIGVMIVAAFSYATPRIGASGTTVLFIVGQLAVATLIGHFGWLETPVRPVDFGKIVGLILLLVGAWLVVRPT